METYLIVEMEITPVSDAIETRHIIRIIRSYESKVRADQDLELLLDIDRNRLFEIATTQHIDR